MVKDAEAHAAEDKKKRELVEARNHAEALVHSTEKQLEENECNAAVAAAKPDVEKAIADLKEPLAPRTPSASRRRPHLPRPP